MISDQYNDAVYGSITLYPIQIALGDTNAFERTDDVTQLGIINKKLRPAKHSRLEHGIGAGYLAGLVADALKLGPQARNTVVAAAQVHDVGHTPFGHSASEYFKERWGYNHEELARKIIFKEKENEEDPDGIYEVLMNYDLSPVFISDLINLDDEEFIEKYGGRDLFMKQMIASQMDVDRLDFLRRDSHHTSVPFGQSVFTNKLLQNVKLRDTGDERGNILVYGESAVTAIQVFFNSYASMYRQVYCDPDIRARQAFLNKALFLAHDYIWDKFSEHHDNPSDIREIELRNALKRIPQDTDEHILAREISEYVFRENGEIINAASFRNGKGFVEERKRVAAIYKKYPLKKGEPDSLETHLIESIPRAVDGEIIVARNVKNLRAKPAKEKGVYIELEESGHSVESKPKSKIVDISQWGGYIEADKITTHPHLLRVLTIRDSYVSPIREMLAEVY